MTGPEREVFAMFMKRDKDDEDLDALALGELNRLHSKYVQKRTKEELEERWKKLGGV
ncbi:MAG TPA: hypothetical protein VI758_04785 [Bacteroidota bacterium]